ncbi:uncharacterized protein LOC133185949 [Saccostrea echinata]|uniref:uncharacterized protein LOC133185949 n=1 Tax=Saccostrea echinata TaxID=191078 RepID=UPI002A7ED474|nr:uncharacterized protein LOC133185949 [Saccostrea echinata]
MSWISFGIFLLGLASAVGQIPGGWTETQVIDEYTRQIVFSVKNDILQTLSANGIPVHEFVPLLSRSRAATGSFHLVKIRIGYGRYIHVEIYRHFSGTPTRLEAIQVGHTKTSPLESFRSW